MKKVAGTLKLDQAQFRELEAFSKFGSDLDAATQAVLDKGRRNVQILIQPQSSPLRVEEEVAIIYCGVKNLLRKLKTTQVAEFQTRYLDLLNSTKKETMQSLKEGKYTEEIETVLKNAAEEIISLMTKKD